jgi:hypothetical protein
MNRSRLSMVLCLPLILALLAPGQGWGGSKNSDESAVKGKSLLVQFQSGGPVHLVSEILYENTRVNSLNIGLDYELASWVFLKKIKLVGSLLTELRLSKIYGRGVPLSRDQVSPQEWVQAQKEGRRPTTNWDLYQIGLTPIYRLYAPLSGDLRPFLEAGIGFTYLQDALIKEGTSWNFLLLLGIGSDLNLCGCQPVTVSLRLEHFSNGGKIGGAWGLTDRRVIGPETMALGLGVRIPF